MLRSDWAPRITTGKLSGSNFYRRRRFDFGREIVADTIQSRPDIVGSGIDIGSLGKLQGNAAAPLFGAGTDFFDIGNTGDGIFYFIGNNLFDFFLSHIGIADRNRQEGIFDRRKQVDRHEFEWHRFGENGTAAGFQGVFGDFVKGNAGNIDAGRPGQKIFINAIPDCRREIIQPLNREGHLQVPRNCRKGNLINPRFHCNREVMEEAGKIQDKDASISEPDRTQRDLSGTGNQLAGMAILLRLVDRKVE